MKKTYVADLMPGTSVTASFLVRAKERKTARNGSAYLDLELQDATGTIKAKVWDCDSCNRSLKLTTWSGFPQASNFTRAILSCPCGRLRSVPKKKSNLLDYLPHGAQDPEKLFQACWAGSRRCLAAARPAAPDL